MAREKTATVCKQFRALGEASERESQLSHFSRGGDGQGFLNLQVSCKIQNMMIMLMV